MALNFKLLLPLLLVASTLLLLDASDPDMLQDFCVADLKSDIKVNGFVCKANPAPEDFRSQALRLPGNTDNPLGSKGTQANVISFPGLNTLGVSANRVDFKEGGLNAPHTHPRATELIFLQQGTLYVGFIDTNNTLFAQKIYAGDLFVIPQGLIHFQLNIGKGPAVSIVFFNGQNPGRSEVAKGVFSSQPPLDDRVLEIAFQLTPEVIPHIREAIANT